jgi:hypothetical protein
MTAPRIAKKIIITFPEAISLYKITGEIASRK